MNRTAATRVPSSLGVFALITVMDIVARFGGLGRAMSLANRLGARADVTANDPNLTAATAKAVILAAAFYPRRALCLEQSLALFVLLRRRGIGAELKVGMRPLPFSAHAWVEVDGAPVNEIQGNIEQLVTFQHVSV